MPVTEQNATRVRPLRVPAEALRIVVGAAVFAFAALLTLALTRVTHGTVSLWIANALVVGYAIRRPGAPLSSLVAMVFAGTLLSAGLPWRQPLAVLAAGAANAIEVAIVLVVLRWMRLRSDEAADGVRVLLGLAVAVGGAPAVGSLLGASVPGPGSWLELFLHWFFADAFGMFVVLPIAWFYTRAAGRALVTGRTGVEFAACALASVAVAFVAVAHLRYPFALLSLPLLLVATRGVLATAICNVLVIATVLAVTSLQQQGVLAATDGVADPAARHAWFQACVAAVGPLLVAVLGAERDRERLQSQQMAERLQVITDNLPAYVAEFGPDLRYRFVNHKYQAWLGLDPAALIGRTPADALGADAAERLRPYMERALAGEPQRFQFELDGQRLDVFYEPLPQSGGFVLLAHDVTWRYQAERALQAERERAQVTLNSIGDAVITCDTARRVTSLNPVAEAMTGLARDAAVGRAFDEVVRLDHVESDDAARAGAALLRRADGEELHVEFAHSPITDGEGRTVGGVTVLRDVSEIRAMAQRMSHLAQHDYLTGLPNRVLLQDRLSQALQPGGRGAVLYLDLDFFKTINDSLGHQAGDRVLQEIARRLCATVRSRDTVSRQGGDEFVLLLARLADPRDAARVAEALIHAVEAPLEIEGRTLHVSASIGIALFPEDGDDIRTLTKHADTALYHAKHAGRARYSYFTAAMSERADERLRLENDLRTAVATDRLFLLYQPKMNLPDRTLSGMEALVRWRHPDGHVVPPGDFIPVAEETGLILAIDAWVLREACRQNRAWIDAGLPALPVAVNLSLARFDPERIVAGIAQALADTGLPAGLLEVELTESQMLGHSGRASQLIDGIRRLGVRVSVDDFGTGYSSLGYLSRHRFDAIKIDRSFVQGLPGERGQRAVVEAILGMACALDCRVVGEGVETEAQAAALLELGCREMQGYLLARPLDAAAMQALLHARRG